MARWTLPMMASMDPYIWVAMITLFVATSIALLVLAALPRRAAKAAAIAEATKESGGGTGDAIPRAGVSLEGLLRFQREVARVQPRWRRALAFLTGTVTAYQTTEDVDQLAKAHLTSERRCAYVEMLDGNPEFVGEATVFISHAWKMRFDTLVDCVREADAAIRVPGHPRYKPGATPYFWIDLLVSDQHSASSRPFTWFEIVFRETVERIGKKNGRTISHSGARGACGRCSARQPDRRIREAEGTPRAGVPGRSPRRVRLRCLSCRFPAMRLLPSAAISNIIST